MKQEQFGQRLKKLRKSRNLTQKELAEFMSLTTRNLQDYEYGAVDPPTSKTIRLADYFNVSLDYLVGRSDDPTMH